MYILAEISFHKNIFEFPFAKSMYPNVQLIAFAYIPNAAQCIISLITINCSEYKSITIQLIKIKKTHKIGDKINMAISA